MNHPRVRLTESEQRFRSVKDGRDFWLFAVVTFLCGLARSSQTLLAVIFEQHAMPVNDMGWVLACAAPAMILAALSAGWFISVFGVYRIAVSGVALMFVGHLSFHWTASESELAAISRLIEGAGFGLFIPASMLFAKNRLGQKSPVYLFGIYSSMMLVPTMIGPMLSEFILLNIGLYYFFAITGLPFLVALLLALAVSELHRGNPGKSAQAFRYSAVLRDRGAFTYWGAILSVSIMSGFVTAFMALYLVQRGLVVAAFFTPFSLALVASRLVLLRFVEGMLPATRMVVSFLLMSIAYWLLQLPTQFLLVVLTGLLFGFGYSVAYPTLSIGLARYYDQQGRAADKISAIAVFNAFYCLGINLMPLAGGQLILLGGFQSVLLILALLGSISAIYLVFRTPAGWNS